MRVPAFVWIVVVLAALAIPAVTYLKFGRQQREPTTRQGVILLVLSAVVVAAIFGLIHLDDQAQP